MAKRIRKGIVCLEKMEQVQLDRDLWLEEDWDGEDNTEQWALVRQDIASARNAERKSHIWRVLHALP